jgi:two-component system, NarL family, response regulator LiaR
MTTTSGWAPITVALVNDFELILRGTEAMLGQFSDRLVVSELDVQSNPDQRVDVALFDTYGHARGGVDRVRSLATDERVGAVAVYTWRLPPGQLEAVVAAGARGVLAKSLPADLLADAVIAIHRGEKVVSPAFHRPTAYSWPGRDLGLTSRESEVAAFLANGCSNREIADALFISEHTVKTHVKAIFRKTGVASRAGAAVRIAQDASFRRRTVA